MPNKKTISIFFIWAFIFCNPPFSFYLIQGFPYLILKLISIFSLSMLLLFNDKFKLSLINKVMIFVIFINGLYYFFTVFYHRDNTAISQIIPLFGIVLIYLVITKISGLELFVKSYILIMIVFGLFGTFAFFLGLIGKLPFLGYLGNEEINSINYLFTFSNAVFNREGDFQLIRVASYFDEPGTFAFYITFALLINQLSFKNPKFDKLLIFTGLFTLSLAFYITLFFQFLFYKDWLKLYFKFVVFISLILFIFSSLKSNYPIIGLLNMATIERFEKSDDGTIKGDNRTIHFAKGLEYFTEKPILGHGKENVLKNERFFGYDPSSFVGFMVFYGLIGTVIIFLIYLLQFKYLFKINNGLSIDHFIFKILFIQLLLFIQRPLINVPLAFLLLILMIELMDLRKNGLIFNKDE